MINVAVEGPRAFGISTKVRLHIFMNQRLQIDAQGSIRPNDLIAAHARVGRNVSIGICDADVSGVVADRVMRAFNGRGRKAGEEQLVWIGFCRGKLGE